MQKNIIFNGLKILLTGAVLLSLAGFSTALAQQDYYADVLLSSPPVAVADSYQVVADTTLSVDAAHGVLANDTDPDGDELTAQLVGHGTGHGTLSLKSNGSFVYTPDAGYIGSDVFVYNAYDGIFESNPVNVTINVTAGDNTPPVAMADTYEVASGTTLTVPAPGVLTNDTDAEGDPLTAQLVGEGTAHGTLNLKSDGSFVYTPDIAYVGSDVFIYEVDDGVFTSNPVNVTINVASGDQTPPVANADTYEVASGTTLTVPAPGVLTNDTDAEIDPLTAQLIGQGTVHGTLSLRADGSFEYTPDVGYVGSDIFIYQAYDGLFTSNPVNVTINVISVDETPPVANADTYTAESGMLLTVDAATGVLANDIDAELDPLTALLVGMGPAHGTLSLHADGSFEYMPDLAYFGSDIFIYQVTDGLFTSNSVNVTINVTSENQTPPVANPDTYTAETGTLLTVDTASGLLANDNDAEDDPLTAQLVGVGPAHGTLALKNDGSFTYKSDLDYVGSDVFVYQASDGVFISNPVNVTINVTSAEETPPVANADTYEVEAGKLLTVAAPGVLINDYDAEGDSLTAALVGEGTAHGTLTFWGDGSFVYRPAMGYYGSDIFIYQVYDGLFTSVPVNVTINVTSLPFVSFYIPVVVK